MKKTFNINLAGLVFTIDEDAYELLRTYLDNVADHFKQVEGKEEIVADIENRIAEHFSSGTRIRTKMSISKHDVEYLITAMGRVDEFGDEESKTDANSTEDKSSILPKRLYRNPDDRILGGVASGIAAYFGTDPVLVRLAFVLLTFASGFGILVYIVLWIITPEAKTAVQKTEMQGKPLTLERIEKEAKKIEDSVKKFVQKK